MLHTHSRLIIKSLYVCFALLACFLRFYQLGDIPKPAFDEVYFARFSYLYIQETPFYHSHPPLAKYVMMAAIKLYYAMPFTESIDFANTEFEQLNPLSYRWINAVLGVLTCLMLAKIVHLLFNQHSLTLLVFAFTSIDGSLVVASRFALSNAHILFWGVLSLLWLILLLKRPCWFYLIALALSLAAVVSVKWNGAVFIVIVISSLLCTYYGRFNSTELSLKTIAHKKFWIYLIGLVTIIPVVYTLVWIPDLKLNQKYDFIETHQQFFSYHKDRVSTDAHPYCSKWYSWPLMYRPISYHFEKIKDPQSKQTTCFKNIHSFGNPFLYWFSFISVLAVTARLIWLAVSKPALLSTSNNHFLLFATGGYFASWLPWSMVSRCTFLYHYQAAACFSFIIFAFVLNHCLRSKNKTAYMIAIILLAVIGWAFIYWLPFQLGIPVSKEGFYARMWFSHWI
ncbi:phospholipid carrier-dependent glycosyltransferase [Gayadomonas joobiniege]|uniref:phospholipid carrier-dependent glycosyltransferase n=1 Tax=Gayadomonas joobiniege TaxID=1234606 RepID=UPI000360C455|nr:phospholipid carrier-dependent glycosyltransferase [Gayadomonas joobiniege]